MLRNNIPAGYIKENLIVGTSAIEHCSFCKRSAGENHAVVDCRRQNQI